MHRLLLAAATASLIAAAAAPVLADDYPPCTHRDQDHCRVMSYSDRGMDHHGMYHRHHHRHHHEK